MINESFQGSIDWPQNLEENRRIGQEFFTITNPGMPCVAGALDGTLVNFSINLKVNRIRID